MSEQLCPAWQRSSLRPGGMEDEGLPAVLVSGFGGPGGVCEDHLGELRKHFNLIGMQEFVGNKTHLGAKIRAVLIWGGKPAVTEELLRSLPALSVVASAGAGLDHLDLKLIASFGVKVANTPDAVSSPTADLGMALLLAAARRVVEGERCGRGGAGPSPAGFAGPSLPGRVHGASRTWLPLGI